MCLYDINKTDSIIKYKINKKKKKKKNVFLYYIQAIIKNN